MGELHWPHRPQWLRRGEFSRINGTLWVALVALLVLSGPTSYALFWIIAQLVRTPDHPLYTLVPAILAVVYLFTLATSKQWRLTIMMLL